MYYISIFILLQFLTIMKGVRRLRPNHALRPPNWDLPLVLDSLTKPPYEPMADADFKALSLKTAFREGRRIVCSIR